MNGWLSDLLVWQALLFAAALIFLSVFLPG